MIEENAADLGGIVQIKRFARVFLDLGAQLLQAFNLLRTEAQSEFHLGGEPLGQRNPHLLKHQ
jgi:hypothetical protein